MVAEMNELKSIVWGLFFVLVMVAWIGHGCRSRMDRWRDYRDERREHFEERRDDRRQKRQDRWGQWQERDRWFHGERWFRRDDSE
jgi:hypothetical protein